MAHDVGLMLTPLGVVAMPTLVIALLCREFAAASALGLVIILAMAGLGMSWLLKQQRQHATPPHVITMAAAWLAASIAAALPFLASALFVAQPSAVTATFASPTNAWFESMSGLTSTGLTVASDPRELPWSLQWWRSTIQWLGGIGILYFILGATLGQDESADPGATQEACDEAGDERGDHHEVRRLGLGRTVRRTWLVYTILTLATFAGFVATGMNAWNAANHAQTAVSTAGFSTQPDSLASYPAGVHAVAAGAMVAGAICFFTLRSLILGGRWSVLARDRQTHWLIVGLALGTLGMIAVTNLSPWDAAFQWLSAFCTGGFSTSTVGEINPAGLLVLWLAMFVGASAGSTGGGLKIARLRRLVRGLLRRDTGSTGDSALVESSRTTRRMALAFLATALTGAVLLYVSADTTFVVALFESTSALCTVGLTAGLTSAETSTAAKIVLIALMWLGRLETLVIVHLLFFRQKHLD